MLLEKLKDSATRLWYARKTLEHGWSRAVLTVQIESRLHERSGKAITNFDRTLPPAQSDLAREALKDPYTFDFLTLGEAAHERDLERGLVGHVQQLLLEMGAGFAFVGRQVHLEVGDEDFYLDLLFYHLRLRCFVVVDLKMKPFEPEFAGKMNFYLSAVDDRMRHEHDAPRDASLRRVRPFSSGQSVKGAEQGGAAIGYDAGKKVSGRKRHVVVDTLGLILGLSVTSAAVQDRDGAASLLSGVYLLFGRLQILWADGGSAGALVAWVKALRPFGRLHLEIVRRSDDAKGFKLVRKRWILERTFSWLYKCRRLARDYERRVDHSESQIYVCMCRLMLKRLTHA